jgi:hypothetical protein
MWATWQKLRLVVLLLEDVSSPQVGISGLGELALQRGAKYKAIRLLKCRQAVATTSTTMRPAGASEIGGQVRVTLASLLPSDLVARRTAPVQRPGDDYCASVLHRQKCPTKLGSTFGLSGQMSSVGWVTVSV